MKNDQSISDSRFYQVLLVERRHPGTYLVLSKSRRQPWRTVKDLSNFHSENHSSKWQRLLIAVGLFWSIALLAVAGGLLFDTTAPHLGLLGLGSPEDELSDTAASKEELFETIAAIARDQLFEYSDFVNGSMFLVSKTPTQKITPKRQGAKKINGTISASKKKSSAAARKRARTLEEARSRTAFGFFEYSCIGLVGFTLIGLFLRYQKEFSDSQSDLKDLTAAPAMRRDGGYQAKAVILSEPVGADPLTYERTDVFQKVAGKQRPQSVTLDLAMDGPELERSISNELDDIISSIKIVDKTTDTLISQMLLLPAEMAGHFEALQGEVLVWSAPLYIKGVCEGMLAITNRRLLALYERRSFKIWMPSVVFQTKRNQTLLGQISLYKPMQVKRPSFLAAGAAIFWWFPFGTVGACVAIAGFLFLTRRELGIWTAKQKRTYPLSMVDLEEAMSSIGKITGMQALGRVEGDNGKSKKAS